MAKKNEIFDVAKNLKVSDVYGTFDVDAESGAYIIISNGISYNFDEYAKNFLGGTIEIHAVEDVG